MRNRRLMIVFSTAALAVAWAWLLARDIVGAGALASLPAWPAALLLALSAAALGAAWTSPRARAGIATAIIFTAIAFVLFHLSRPGDVGTRRAWWRDSSHRISATLGAVGDEIASLEDVSVGLGSRVRAYLAAQNAVALRSDPTGVFALLDSLAGSVSRGRSLTPGTAIGLQLFAPDGQRIAWAGWPQQTAEMDHSFLASGQEFSYTRSVSLYQILSHVVPCRNTNGDVVATLLVDMPLEVDYRVNNRFLKSASIANTMPGIASSRVSFEYFPPGGNLPQRLEKFREQHAASREARAQLLAAARARPVTAPAPGVADTVLTAGLSWRDSLLTYGAFPENVQPEGEVSGNEATGLGGRALILSRFGNPLLNAEAAAEPFDHFAAQRTDSRGALGMVFILLALVAIFAQAMQWIAAAGSHSRGQRAARAMVFGAFMLTLRFSLLAFGTSSTRSGSRLFDPSVFATPALGGLMRSTFDLALTAVFFIALVYGLVRIARSGRRLALPTPLARPAAWRIVISGLVVGGAGVGALVLVRRLTETVVVNANPRLLGETMALTDLTVLVLHVSLFLIISGLLLAAVFGAWGVMRALGVTRAIVPCLIAVGVAGVVGFAEHSWALVALMVPFAWFVLFAPRIAQREDLVSVGIASFALVAITSGVAYVYLTRDYDELRKNFVLEKSKEVSSPADNWKVVILEDVLGDYAERAEIRQAVRLPGVANETERLAFDLWADSPLSLLGYSCAIHVLNAQDSVVSEFSVDMPYRARIAEGGERTDTPEGDRWAVLDLTRSTPQGSVRFYRGVVNIDESGAFEDTTLVMPRLGKVIVDLPFFFESLELAARTGPRTPEVLRNVQQGGVAPRVEEPEALLLARVDAEGRITESSSEQLPVGAHVRGSIIASALAGQWPVLSSDTRTYRVLALPSADSTGTLLAGFVVPSPRNHLLRWSTVLSLYMSFALVCLIVLLALGAVPRVKHVLPTLTPGRRVGFQQKLLASFLMVALVPAILLGAFSVDFIKQR
ncbi:MAG TPA: hypothetical protein VF247_01620, partial [Candidatus Krumholzibacteria bacterium]